MWKNTLIIVFGDNGGDVTTGASNWPYRGTKTSVFEGGTRVAAFISSPNPHLIPVERRGTESHTLMHVTDWFPTLLDLAGYEGNPAKEGNPLDGVKLWDALVTGIYDPVHGPRTEMLYALDTVVPAGGEDAFWALLAKQVQTFINVTALRIGDWYGTFSPCPSITLRDQF
jgi:arylsulfatase I/J